MDNKQQKQKRDATRNAFLRTLFPEQNKYQEINMNGFWLIQQQCSNGTWSVAILDQETYDKRQEYLFKQEITEQN